MTSLDRAGLNPEMLDRADLTEKSYRILRESILKRKIRPGEQMSAGKIAGRLGVSRSPVMDAFKQLAADGLVEIVPRRGTFVTLLTSDDVGELFEIRTLIEEYAADRLLDSGKIDEYLERVAGPLQGMEQSILDGEFENYDSFMDNDRKFHFQLVEMTGNQRLIQIYNDLHVHIYVARAHYLRYVQQARQTQAEHQAILDALTQGQREKAHRAIRTHIVNVRNRILELLEERGGKL